MNANRFDTLSRQFGTAKSRRGVLRLAGTCRCSAPWRASRASRPGPRRRWIGWGIGRSSIRQRQDRKDHHEQRKGKRNDGGGDEKNDGPSLRGVSCPAGTVELPNGSCAIACTFDGFPGGRTVRTTWPGPPRVQDRSAPANRSKPSDNNCAWWFRRPWIKDAVRQRTAPRGLPAPRAPAPLEGTSALHSAHCRLPDPGRDR